LSPDEFEERSEELARRKGAYEDAVDAERIRAETQQAQALAAEQIPDIFTLPSVADPNLGTPWQGQVVSAPRGYAKEALARSELFTLKFRPLDAAVVKKAFQDVNEYYFQKTKKADFVETMMEKQGLLRSNAASVETSRRRNCWKVDSSIVRYRKVSSDERKNDSGTSIRLHFH